MRAELTGKIFRNLRATDRKIRQQVHIAQKLTGIRPQTEFIEAFAMRSVELLPRVPFVCVVGLIGKPAPLTIHLRYL